MRQVFIRCRVTRELVPTGVETTSIEALENRPYLLIDCLGCGDDHTWVAADATTSVNKLEIAAQERW